MISDNGYCSRAALCSSLAMACSKYLRVYTPETLSIEDMSRRWRFSIRILMTAARPWHTRKVCSLNGLNADDDDRYKYPSMLLVNRGRDRRWSGLNEESSIPPSKSGMHITALMCSGSPRSARRCLSPGSSLMRMPLDCNLAWSSTGRNSAATGAVPTQYVGITSPLSSSITHAVSAAAISARTDRILSTLYWWFDRGLSSISSRRSTTHSTTPALGITKLHAASFESLLNSSIKPKKLVRVSDSLWRSRPSSLRVNPHSLSNMDLLMANRRSRTVCLLCDRMNVRWYSCGTFLAKRYSRSAAEAYAAAARSKSP